MKNCYYCGADVPDQSKFCPKCGKSIAVTQDLIDRAKANDPDAQAELYERTYKTTYSRIRAKVPDEDTAMDIMQESYLNAFTHLDQLQRPETFPSWLLSIAGRQVCDWYRKNGKEKENIQMSQLEYGNDDAIPDESDILEEPEYREDFLPDESLDQVETGRLLSEILDTLPEDQRIILTMRYYDEMSLNEISEDLGVNLSTVKTRLKLGKKKVEEKVLELEKSGTKLYSLGPVAFLVYLLHHMELFAPDIPANTIIGLTAAGAGGTAAANVTAGATAKAAATTAAKGISAKVIAIIAAAVVVVGGGITAAVLLSQPAGTAGTDNAETAQMMSVKLTPEKTATVTEEEIDEVEPEPSEQPDDEDMTEETPEDDTDAPEETPEEETEQQELEPAESEGNQEEDAQEEPVALPTEDDILSLANVIVPRWGLTATASPGHVDLNTNQAVEMATLIAYYDLQLMNPGPPVFDSYYIVDSYPNSIVVYIIPDSTVQTYMTKLFGSQFLLSDFSYTGTQSAFETSIPGYVNFFEAYVSRNDDGNFEICTGEGENYYTADNINIESITPDGENNCLAVIHFDSSEYGEFNRKTHTMSLEMVRDPSAEYGWAITSISIDI